MTDDELTDDELRQVVRHGGSPFTRALAVAVLARRNNAVDDVLETTDEITDDDSNGRATP